MMQNSNASRGHADDTPFTNTHAASTAPDTAQTLAQRRGRRYAPEIWRAIGPRYIAGETAADLAREFGMTASSIYYQALKNGWSKTVTMADIVLPPDIIERESKIITLDDLDDLPPKRRFERRVHHTDHAKNMALRAHIEWGWTQSKIFEKFGMKPASLATLKRQRGVTKTKAAIGPPPDIDFDPVPPPPPPPWKDIAHPAQIAPSGAWFTWLFQGGRGAGKTRAGAEWIAAQADANDKGIFALVGATHHDVREVMIEGPAGLMNLPGRPPPRFESSRRRLLFPNGAIAYAFSAEEPRRLRGPQFDGAWADEFCAWDNRKATLDMLRFGLRRGADPRLVITTTPRPIKELIALRAEKSCVLTQAPSAANADHLSPRFLEGLYELYADTDLAKQELEGELLDMPERGVWTAEKLKTWRGPRPHAFERVVVAVDPPATTGGSACGIVVAGRIGRRGFVLADRTVRDLSPLGWALRVTEAAREFNADAIVAESNQGGEMVRATIAQTDPPCSIDLVRARYGKRERATPVAMLYEKGLVTHCGAFALLEEEMMALDGAGEGTFDRADALVWALTVLMFDEREAFAPGIRQL